MAMEVKKVYNCTMKKYRLLPVLVIFAATVLFVSCTDFFSKSWASWAARDPDKLIPKVTAGNVDELIAAAENNTDLSFAVLKKIQDAANNMSGDDLLTLQSAALGAATNAVGLGQSVLNAAGQLSSVDDINDAKDLILDAINGMKNLEATSSILCDLLPEPYDENGVITDDFRAFSQKASANDLAMAAALMIANEAKSELINSGKELNEYVNDLVDKINNDDLNPSESMARAMALASVLADRQDELSGPLKSVLDGLNLTYGSHP